MRMLDTSKLEETSAPSTAIILFTFGIPERREEPASWVSDLDFSQYQSQAFERYTEGTLLWVLEKPQFVGWLSNGGILWCPGKPGAGKTVFASFIINHLQNLSLNPKATVCYIYHRYDTTRSTLQFFEAILKQLIIRCPSVNVDRVRAAKDQGQRLTLKEVLSILQETFDRVGNIFLVIDAFDECSDEATRHQVLRHLQALNSVKTLITSRHLPSIERAMGPVATLVISAHSGDVQTHFRAERTINPRLDALLSPVSSADVERKLIEKADGRFLLAGLHMKNLAAQTNTTQLLRALEALPHEVVATYEETLSRIRRQDPALRRLAFHTLSWILHALRPLKMTELRHALAIGNLDRMAEKQDLDTDESITSSCAGLVVVNMSREWGKKIVRVNFLHYTVQEFLQQARTAPDFLSDVDITLRCMKVVSFPGITSNPLNYPLTRYAASAWGPLVRRHEQVDTVLELALSQLSNPVTVGILSNVPIDSELQSYHREYWGRSGASAIHLITVYGLTRTMKVFVAQAYTAINERDMQGCTALIWAAENGHLEAVKELLNHPNVDVDSKDELGRTPLSYAARHGHLEVVRELLIHQNVNVNSKSDTGLTPLSYAARQGHLGVVKELLTHRSVDVNSKAKFGHTPLALAARSGHLEVVKELTAYQNVDVDSKSDSGLTPLSYAAREGHSEVVEFLVNTLHVNINSRDTWCGLTPLLWAANHGHLRVVAFFLDTRRIERPGATGLYPQRPAGTVHRVSGFRSKVPDSEIVASLSE